MARNASGVSSWLLVHNLGRLICSLHRRLEKILPGHVGLDLAPDRRITSRRKTDFLIFPRKLPLLEKPSRSLRRELKCLNRHAPWPSCQMILIRPPRRPLKRRDHQRADPASNSPEPDAQGSGTYDNRTHSSSFRQIKKKAVQFKCGRPLANYRDLWLQLPPRIERHANHSRGGGLASMRCASDRSIELMETISIIE